jgi:hypothetical protein
MEKKTFTTVSVSAAREKTARQQFFELFQRCPIPDNELLGNLGLFINRQSLSRILYMHDLYRRIINGRASSWSSGRAGDRIWRCSIPSAESAFQTISGNHHRLCVFRYGSLRPAKSAWKW